MIFLRTSNHLNHDNQLSERRVTVARETFAGHQPVLGGPAWWFIHQVGYNPGDFSGRLPYFAH
jgi:hypothetical protein